LKPLLSAHRELLREQQLISSSISSNTGILATFFRSGPAFDLESAKQALREVESKLEVIGSKVADLISQRKLLKDRYSALHGEFGKSLDRTVESFSRRLRLRYTKPTISEE
jgi:hypothetical protein